MFLLFWLHPVLSLITVKSHLVISGWSITGYKKSPWGAQSSELMDSPSFFFFFIIIQYTPPCSATSAASIKDIKATGYIFIISNHIVFTALCLWGGSWKWKYLHDGRRAQLLFIGSKRRRRRKKRKQKEKTNCEPQIMAVCHLLASCALMRKRGAFWCFSYLTFPFYLPRLHGLDRRALQRGDEALRVFNGFFVLRSLKSLSSGSSQIFRR